MSFHVSLTTEAEADLELLFDWISAQSQQGALAWFQSWQAIRGAIADRAEDFELAPESPPHLEPIRQAFFKTRRGRRYRVVYFVRGNDAFVLRIRASGQDLLHPNEIPTV